MIPTASRPRARFAPLLLAFASACTPWLSAAPLATATYVLPPPLIVAAPEPLPPPPPPPPVVALPPPLRVAGNCSYTPPPTTRIAGDLSVSSPPRQRSRPHFGGRLRSDVEGPLQRGGRRTWVGRDVPEFVLLQGGTRELILLDQAPDGFVGVYRDPYGASSCTLGGTTNCSFGVALFECVGQTRWLFLLDPFLSRKDHLEVQDVRYADGVLYFNEACQSYSREAQGQCSAMVAVEPLTKTVLWRTRPLVSNGIFLVEGRYLITGYGFTAEPDALFIVRRSDGKVMSRTSIPLAHEDLELGASGILHVRMYNDHELQFRAVGFDGDHPRLEPVPVFRK